jgi:uncharacterized repeat protein (TIGR02543 family)
MQSYNDTALSRSVNLVFATERISGLGAFDIISASSQDADYEFSIAAGEGKVTVIRRMLSVVATDTEVIKAYDGNALYLGALTKGIHYNIANCVADYEADIIVIGARFNAANVSDANEVIVEYKAELIDANGVYGITGGSFVLSAHIVPKEVAYTPQRYIKQYGDADPSFAATCFDDATDTAIEITLVRAVGESVGNYAFISAVTADTNFTIGLVGAANSFVIAKRQITVSATAAVISKVFDNSMTNVTALQRGAHYTFSNLLAGDETDIYFSTAYDSCNAGERRLILSQLALIQNADKYELITVEFSISAHITPKPITIEPQPFVKQYGESDYLVQGYTDGALELSCEIIFTRESGEDAGEYDILTAVERNANYSVTLANGANKFRIVPRVLGVEIIGTPTFTKIYDGTDACNIPITQGIHYKLTNLNGGDEVSLTIIEQAFDSAYVTEAARVIAKYTALLSGADAGNFVTIGGQFEFFASITPRNIEIVPNLFTKKYTENIELRQFIPDAVSGDSMLVTYDSTAGNPHALTDAGIYDITAVHWTDTNHTFTIASTAGAGKYVIERNDITITAYDRNTVYNGAEQAINAPYSVPDKTLYVLYKPVASGDGAFSATIPTNAGLYTARAVFDGDNNYNGTYTERTLFIERAAAVITDTTPTDYVYDGNIKPLTALLNHSETVLEFSRNDHINAGVYPYVLISSAQTTNYKAASIAVSLTIAKQVISNASMVYPTASALTYGQYLSAAVLSGGSALGRFAWEDGDVLPIVTDTQFLVSFTPIDVNNYDWSDVDTERYVGVTVNKRVIVSIAFPAASAVLSGQKLLQSILNGTSPYGSFAWKNPNTIPDTRAGAYPVVFTPYDTANYDFSGVAFEQNVTVEVCFPIHFVTNGAGDMADLLVFTLNTAPFVFRNGYVFEGWYMDAAFNVPVTYPYSVNNEVTFYALWRGAGLTFTLVGNEYTVSIDGATVQPYLIIPSEYKGKPVTRIADNGFSGNAAIEYVYIPESVTLIGSRAFYNCVNLTNIEINNSQANINVGANWNKTGNPLTDVYFSKD